MGRMWTDLLQPFLENIDRRSNEILGVASREWQRHFLKYIGTLSRHRFGHFFGSPLTCDIFKHNGFKATGMCSISNVGTKRRSASYYTGSRELQVAGKTWYLFDHSPVVLQASIYSDSLRQTLHHSHFNKRTRCQKFAWLSRLAKLGETETLAVMPSSPRHFPHFSFPHSFAMLFCNLPVWIQPDRVMSVLLSRAVRARSAAKSGVSLFCPVRAQKQFCLRH